MGAVAIPVGLGLFGFVALLVVLARHDERRIAADWAAVLSRKGLAAARSAGDMATGIRRFLAADLEHDAEGQETVRFMRELLATVERASPAMRRMLWAIGLK